MAQKLKNPRTGSELTSKTFGGVELDVDEGTGGVWMDGGELNQLTEWFGDGDEFASFAARFSGERAHHTVNGPCPRCGSATMKEYPLPTVSGDSVTLDICSLCKGFWVDGPELGHLRETMMKNRESNFVARIVIPSKRPVFMRLIYPDVVKNIVDRRRS